MIVDIERRQSMISLHERVAALETRGIAVHEDIKEILSCIKGDGDGMNSLSGRIRALEHWRSWVNGISATIATLFVTITTFLSLRKEG